jgi:DNA-binding IclR family transcriptional regulator
MSQHNTVKSDETLFSLIEALRELDEPGVTELAQRLDMAKSAVHKHLKTLENHEYVINNNGNYRLSFRFLSLGGHVVEEVDMSRHAASKARQLAEDTDTFVMFAIKEYSRGVFTCVYNDQFGIRRTSPLGKRFYLHSNASGKAILATLSDEEIDEIIDSAGLPYRTPNTITTREDLFEEIDEIRATGYATSYQERVEGAQSIAASVRDTRAGMVGAISITRPATPSKSEYPPELKDRVTEAARELELEIKLK